jgi:hypothetical protein
MIIGLLKKKQYAIMIKQYPPSTSTLSRKATNFAEQEALEPVFHTHDQLTFKLSCSGFVSFHCVMAVIAAVLTGTQT